MTGTDTVLGFKGPVKAGIVRKAAAAADLLGTLSLGQQLSCKKKPSEHNIPVNTDPYLPAEGMGQVIFAYEEACCQLFQGNLLLFLCNHYSKLEFILSL